MTTRSGSTITLALAFALLAASARAQTPPPRDAQTVRAELVSAYGQCQTAARGASVEAALAACLDARGRVAELDAALALYPAGPAVDAWKKFAADTRLALDTALGALNRTGPAQVIAANTPGVLEIGGARTRVMAGAPLPMNVVTFAADKAVMAPEQFPVLADFAAFMQSNPSLRVRVEGHADDRGGAAKNQALSLARATAVSRFLMQNGVPEAALTVVGHGREKPLDTGKTPEAHARNRRVELNPIEPPPTPPPGGIDAALPPLP